MLMNLVHEILFITRNSRWETSMWLLSLTEARIEICCCSVIHLCPGLCDPMDCSIPSFLVLHHLLELAQTHVRWVSYAIQSSRPLSSPSSAFSLSQHRGLFQWVRSLHQVAKVLEPLPVHLLDWISLNLPNPCLAMREFSLVTCSPESHVCGS